jgi:hypothetical protein
VITRMSTTLKHGRYKKRGQGKREPSVLLIHFKNRKHCKITAGTKLSKTNIASTGIAKTGK